MIRQVLGKILLYSFLVFFLVQYGGDYGFKPLAITSSGGSEFTLYIILGVVFWFIYDIIRRIVRIITKPLSWLTLGIIGILINIVAIYAFAYVATYVIDMGIIVQPGTPLEIIFFSLIVRVIDVLF